jgi:hypothetical protein
VAFSQPVGAGSIVRVGGSIVQVGRSNGGLDVLMRLSVSVVVCQCDDNALAAVRGSRRAFYRTGHTSHQNMETSAIAPLLFSNLGRNLCKMLVASPPRPARQTTFFLVKKPPCVYEAG